MPLMGYIWEQDGRIVGNASLIPFRDHGKRIYLIANVATHPDFRRRGIGRALTERVTQHARAKNAPAIWLHVRDDNPGAIKLYEDLGFQEIARRSNWQAISDRFLSPPATDLQIVPRQPRFWALQQDWLRRLYPESCSVRFLHQLRGRNSHTSRLRPVVAGVRRRDHRLKLNHHSAEAGGVRCKSP